MMSETMDKFFDKHVRWYGKYMKSYFDQLEKKLGEIVEMTEDQISVKQA